MIVLSKQYDNDNNKTIGNFYNQVLKNFYEQSPFKDLRYSFIAHSPEVPFPMFKKKFEVNPSEINRSFTLWLPVEKLNKNITKFTQNNPLYSIHYKIDINEKEIKINYYKSEYNCPITFRLQRKAPPSTYAAFFEGVLIHMNEVCKEYKQWLK